MGIGMDAGGGGARPNPLARIKRAISAWRERARDRRALAAMDGPPLRDISLSRHEILAEIARWRPQA